MSSSYRQDRSGNGGDAKPRLQRITSAYNFAPLAKTVVCPPWQDRVSQDVPLQDGLCAELDIELTNHTPLLVGAEREGTGPGNPVKQWTLPDGTPALPGSALRGMLRNVLEIATFSRMQLMDDKALSLRDVTAAAGEYKRRITETVAKNEYKPKSLAGWLRFDGSSWLLDEVKYARVDFAEIDAFLDAGWEERIRSRASWRATASQKYRQIAGLLRSAGYSSDPEDFRVRFVPVGRTVVKDGKAGRLAVTRHQHSDGKVLHYMKVEKLTPFASEGGIPGVLVLTGQPNNKKHMDFVFFDYAKEQRRPTRKVEQAIIDAFIEVHANEEGEWMQRWRGYAIKNQPVPVFFLNDEKDPSRIAAVGLTQMFRLAGPRSLGQIATALQEPRSEGPRPLDFVETLFGFVQGDQSAKGRISIGNAKLDDPARGAPLNAEAKYQEQTVLAQPKPGFYLNYLQQQPSNRPAGKPHDERGATTILSDDAQLRGWKRYPVRPLAEVALVAPPEQDQPSNSRLQPLRPGLTFRATVRVHNVTREELGAVIWALTWGGNPELRHALGMGKPFGFGQVSIRLTGASVRPNDPAATAPDPSHCQAAFETFMQQQVPGWRNQASVKELRAMANPTLKQATHGVLKPLTLKLGAGGINEFASAKNGGLTLPPYSDMPPASKS